MATRTDDHGEDPGPDPFPPGEGLDSDPELNPDAPWALPYVAPENLVVAQDRLRALPRSVLARLVAVPVISNHPDTFAVISGEAQVRSSLQALVGRPVELITSDEAALRGILEEEQARGTRRGPGLRPERRTEGRVSPVMDLECRCTVRDGPGEGLEFIGHVLDLSSKGMRLRGTLLSSGQAFNELESGTEMHIELGLPSEGHPMLRFVGLVQWVQAGDDSNFPSVGLATRPESQWDRIRMARLLVRLRQQASKHGTPEAEEILALWEAVTKG